MPYKNTEQEYELKQLKSKNDKVKSQYIHFCQQNEGRERSLVTFTIPSMENKQKQLLAIKQIKNYFSKRLQSLKCNVQYFMVIELGASRNNPHLHAQLFYEKENKLKIEKAHDKTLKEFSLKKERCKIVYDDKKISSTSSYNYSIKEFDNKQLSDEEILLLDKVRKELKTGANKYIQFHSKSRPSQTQPIYKHFWFKHGMTYNNVNELFNGYARRFNIPSESFYIKFKYPCFRLGNTVIVIDIVKLYELILLKLLFLNLLKSSERCIYCNKSYIYKELKSISFINSYRSRELRIKKKLLTLNSHQYI
ncbi:MAG: Unknown protein [uncultured Sulfurovum sp.]|uniref:Replication-associated protein ORF2/G2P domain-containing protein n=1 Tax=uncultured Sulfurovum sp. TaxID=269237 RepID=A0A6S6SLY1_9BACT|nr:MAG: Unknown protein [uncultured Sulfurovum sp.]